MASSLDPELLKWLDGRFEALSSKMDESDRRASDSRKDVYRKLEEQARALQENQHELQTVKNDVSHLNNSWESARPTLAEFTTWQTRVHDAGKVGRLLWIVGGFVLFGAAWLVAKWDNIAAAFRAFNGR